MLAKSILGALVLTAMAANCSANVLNLNYSAAPNQMTYVSGDAGMSFTAGDTVNADVKFAPGSAVQNATSMWLASGLNECGTRNADFTWQLVEHGTVVNSGGDNESVSCVHIGPYVGDVNFSGLFDEVRWSAKVLASTTSTNTLNTGSYFFLSGQWTADTPDSRVPEPASLALLGLGALACVASRRKQA